MGIGGTNGSVTYFPNEAGIKEVGFMPGMRAFTTDMATRYARVTNGLTPLGQKGMVRRAIRVGVPGADRISVFTDVYGAWSFWHFVEFGTMTNPPYAPFRLGAEQLGFRWEDPGKNATAH